jgi:hypothetical protein
MRAANVDQRGTKSMAQDTCAHCEGSDFARGLPIRINLIATGSGFGSIRGALGVGVREPVKGWLSNFKNSEEALVCDLCKKCGTIRRVYVRNPNQNWVDL